MKKHVQNLSISDFTYDLPNERIAVKPTENRAESKLLVYNQDSISETVVILNKLLKNPDYRVAALTNWSAETFPVALERFEFLHRFEGIVVSGTEKTRKPFPEIYQLTLDRFGFKAKESLFIDDNLRNIEAAAEMGIHIIHFNSPADLECNLKAKAIRI